MKKLFEATYFVNREIAETKTIKAETITKAREKANTYVIAGNFDVIRVHERLTDIDGNILENTLQKTALLIAKKSAEKSIERTGGNDTQIRICDNLKKASAIILNYENVVNEKSGLKLFRFVGYKEDKNGELQKVKSCDILAENKEKAEEQKPQGNFDFVTFENQSFSDKITQALETLCPDSMEYYGQAQTALCQAIADGKPTHEQYRQAYLSINSYIMKLRTATAKEQSTEYIQQNNGDIVSVGNYYGKILKGKAEYIPTETATEDNVENEIALFETLKNCGLTPRQMQVVLLSIKGYSQRQIAEKLKVKSQKTVFEHFVSIRKKALSHLLENYPDIAKKIK